jgi:hypothetical protein
MLIDKKRAQMIALVIVDSGKAFEPDTLSLRPATRHLQFGAQPLAARHRRLAAALHLVRLAARAAPAGRTLDELLRAGDRALVHQVIQLASQMRLRLDRRCQLLLRLNWQPDAASRDSRPSISPRAAGDSVAA